MRKFSPLPEPPYYAVIFTNQASSDMIGYLEMAEMMDQLASTQEGYIGRESARDTEGFAVTVSYWRDEAAIKNWRENIKHAAAQQTGKARWYERYSLRVAKVERQYEGPDGR
jgi:heme-degrading monooxygenase HmoA